MFSPQLGLSWLPVVDDWIEQLANWENNENPSWDDCVSLSRARIDFMQTDRLDRSYRHLFGANLPKGLTTRPVRLAILSSSTTYHLLPGIRIGALRRGIHVSIYEGDYGQYYQDILDQFSKLYEFAPDVVLLALDAQHLFGNISTGALQHLQDCWAILQKRLNATVIQQTVLPVFAPVVGSNEHCLPSSRAALVTELNADMRSAAAKAGVHLLAIDTRAAQDGIRNWHDRALWYRAKQDVTPLAAPIYGHMVSNILAALQGLGAKCLVLDLDNTIWGGVIGDDGLDGIVLGHGNATGEAFLAIQDYALQLSRRGILIAICSKNDHQVAFEAFRDHPEMLLKTNQIASFVANWDDKATNLRRIAAELNIGLDSLVFVDDNPFERNLVRKEVPEVFVPEVPGEDPEEIPSVLAEAGYFEAVTITDDDLARSGQYVANKSREEVRSISVDLEGYLRDLDMTLFFSKFNDVSLGRIVQLINKTNQFNLRTQRYTEPEIKALMLDPNAFGLQFRLVDRFGDNGIVAIVIGKVDKDRCCHIDTWLMSCRVLGRQVEQATLNIIAAEAIKFGTTRLLGEYIATRKNGIVKDFYPRLGFQADASRGGSYSLDLQGYVPRNAAMKIAEVPQ